MTVDTGKPEGFFETHKLRFGKCLEPRLACEQKAIRAHSVQNARVIELIATNGHAIMPGMRISKGAPEIEFQSVGRNQASTFTGLCGVHDAELFAPIDTRDLDMNDREQLFLPAYRSVTRELHAVMEGAVKVQTAYSARVKQGIDPADKASPAGMLATGHLLKAFETYRYRANCFDEALVARQYDGLTHDVLVFDDQPPYIAVSSLFGLDEVHDDDDLVRVVLNVVPVNAQRALAIFSYADRDSGRARPALDRVPGTSGAHQKYELSKLILSRIENFPISPAHFESWSVEKMRRVTDAFVGTALRNPPLMEHPDLMLF
jgi:hypothetical protein